MDMVEKVAATLAVDDYDGKWSNAAQYVRDYYMLQARAALRALREPSEAMKKAAFDAAFFGGGFDDQWQAAIDAALGEDR